MKFQQFGQQKVSLSPFVLWLIFTYIITSWSIYFWLLLGFVVLLLPVLLVITVVLAITLFILSRAKKGKLKIHLSLVNAVLLVLSLIVIGASAPFYSTWYATQMAEEFIQQLDIQVVQKEQTIQRVSQFDDAAPARHVQTVYQLVESSDIAKEKIRQQLREEDGWFLVNEPWGLLYELHLMCSQEVPFYSSTAFWNSVILEDGELRITLYYHSSPRCRLQESVMIPQ